MLVYFWHNGRQKIGWSGYNNELLVAGEANTINMSRIGMEPSVLFPISCLLYVYTRKMSQWMYLSMNVDIALLRERNSYISGYCSKQDRQLDISLT